MIDLTLGSLAILVAAAFAAGFVDSIAGGGGLITVPALLIAGFSPVQSLGTNKLQGLFGAGSATLTYAARGQVDLKRQMPMALLALAGGAVGAGLASLLPSALLKGALPVVLIAIALYFALKPRMDDIDRTERVRPFLFGLTLVPLIGMYDGLFGPGTGSFYMLAFVSLAGFGILKATAHTKLLNLASNVGGFIVFAFIGAIAWKVGLLMGIGQVIGARVGASLAIRHGSRLIKPLLVVVCVALAIKLLADPTNPLRLALGF